MLNHIHIDRRVLYGFLLIATAMNAAVFLLSWKAIMAGKNDFPPLYASAQMVREGQASHIYDFEIENSYVRRTSDVTRPPNNHLPYENLVFIPFTYLPFWLAQTCWTLVSLATLACVALMIRDMWPDRLSFSLTSLTMLGFFPIWYCLLQGQDSILLLFLFALSFWLWRRGQDDAAGFVLAMGLFRPQLVLPFACVALLAGKWKFVRGFVPGVLLAVGLSTWIVGFRGMAEYARILISQGTQSSATTLVEQWHVSPSLMPTLRGLLWILLPPSVAGVVRTFLLLAGISCGLLWAAKGIRKAKDLASLDVAFALAVAIVVLVSFHSFLHDFSLMILPVLIVGSVVASSVGATRRIAYTAVTTVFSFFFTPLYIVLLFTDKMGLFVLPTLGFLWLINRWQPDRLPATAVAHDLGEPVSLRAM